MAQANKTGKLYDNDFVIVYNIQLDSKPVIIQQILIGFEAVLKLTTLILQFLSNYDLFLYYYGIKSKQIYI